MEQRQMDEITPKEIYQNMMFWIDQYKNIPNGDTEMIRSQGQIVDIYNYLADMSDKFDSAEFIDELNMMRERFVEFTVEAVKNAKSDQDAYTNLFNMFEDWGVILGCKLKPMEEL